MAVTRRSVIKPRSIIRLLILGLLIYLLAAGFGGLRLIAAAMESADPYHICLAVMAIGASYLFATFTYMLLSHKKIQFLPTFTIEIATGLTNRLLPGGLGGLGLNAYYLKKRGHTLPVAVSIVGLNNTLGFVGNILLVLAAWLLFDIHVPRLEMTRYTWAVTAAACAVIAGAVSYVYLRRSLAAELRRPLTGALSYVRSALHRPGRTSAALASSMLLTFLHAAAMYFVLSALDIDVIAPYALLAISAGAVAGAAVPTPGGLGGAEAGIVSVLVAIGVPAASAIPAALIYRGITYWLPLLPGYAALRVAEKWYM